MDFGRILDAKFKIVVANIVSKIIVFLDRFLEAYVNIGGAASRLRLDCEWCTFGGRRPWGAPLSSFFGLHLSKMLSRSQPNFH